MRIGSTILFAVAAFEIAETVYNVERAIGGDSAWLTSYLAVGALVTTIIGLYIGLRLFRDGM